MISVFIITEVRSYRDALGRAIGATDRIQVVGTAEHPLPAIPAIRRLHPDVTLLDLSAPEGPMWGKELKGLPAARALVVLGLREPEADLAAWAEIEADGYLGHDASLEDVCAAILEATSGAPESVDGSRKGGGDADRHLTAREMEIVGLLAQGLSNEEIAGHLFIALATVKNHVHNILEKLGVSRREGGVRQIRRAGFSMAQSRRMHPSSLHTPRMPALHLVPRDPEEAVLRRPTS